MNDHTRRETLEDVLDAYVATVSAPDSASLREWIERYPQFEQELTEFAVAWSRSHWLPAASGPALTDDTVILRGMSIVRNLLHEKAAEKPGAVNSTTELKGIIEESRTVGLNIELLADLTDLSAALVRKLDRRLVRYATIPLQVIENLAHAIQREVLEVVRYLQGPPMLVRGARYRARRPPTLADQEDFFDAVQKDPELTGERRRRWLALKPREH